MKTCAQNLQRGVEVLAQGPSHDATYANGHRRQTWIDEMYAAVPDLNAYRGGWTIHPYGPDDYEMDNLQRDLAGQDAAGEYFLTEYGIATDRALEGEVPADQSDVVVSDRRPARADGSENG